MTHFDGNAGGLRPSRPSPTEVAWAAGLFEGEGCWNAYVRSSGKVQMQARLGMTDRDVVERFAAIVGFGNVSVHVHHNQPNWKTMYDWKIYEAEKVRELVAMFLPYMGERRRAKALSMLEAGANVRSHNEKKTHCPKGHPYSGDNVLIEKVYRASGEYEGRRCRTCRQARDNARKRVATI